MVFIYSERLDYDSKQIVQPLGSSFSTTIEMGMHVPASQELVYMPGVMETMKFALVQYLFLLIPTLWFTNALLGFLFKYRIFEAILISDLKPKRKIF